MLQKFSTVLGSTRFEARNAMRIWKWLAVTIMSGLATIGTGTAMESAKMVTEGAADDANVVTENAAIAEHNGVYGGKWHIVSPEGFDLPEGLEYLRNNASDSFCEARSNAEIKAMVVVNNIEVEYALNEMLRVLYKNCAYGISLTFKNCYSPATEHCFNFQRVNKLSFHVKELIFDKVNITFEDLYELRIADMKGQSDFKLEERKQLIREFREYYEEIWK